MKVKSRRCLSALLAFVMLFCAAPICGSAEEETAPITEVVALREENVKHFDLGNGQYHAISYSYPVHKLDSEGNWVDINTALTTGNARSLGQYATEDGRVTVSQTFRPGSQILSMQEDGKGIAMSMVADSSNVSTFSMSRAAVENAPVRSELTEYATIEEATSGDYGSRVYYEDVLPNTDLEYIVDIDMVKENIIVKAAQESYSYTFALDLTGLSAQLEDEGSVSLIDTATQERKYMIPAPYMYDAQGNASFDAAYTLTQEGNTCYLTVTADADWINTQGRQFPITIDPTISRTGLASTVEDTYIDSDYPTRTHADSRALWARINRISYFKCENITLPAGANLQSAKLSVWYGYLDYMDSGYVNVEAYRVDSPWSDDTLTWSVASQDPDYLIDTAVMHYENNLYAGQGATLSSPDRADFLIYHVVDAWLNKGYANHGVALKYGGGSNQSVVFKSSETESVYRPRILYDYRIPYSYKINLDLLYSTAYANRHTDAVTRINREISALQQKFINDFGIRVEVNTPRSFCSLVDTSCSPSPTAECDHATNNSQCYNQHLGIGDSEALLHHTSAYHVLNQLSTPDITQTFRLAYIGQELCGWSALSDDYVHAVGMIDGLAMPASGKAIVADHDGETSETATLIHEFGHLLGAPDHYGSSVAANNPETIYGVAGFSDNCIYGLNRLNGTVQANSSICQGCATMIRNSISTKAHG